jgi:CBS domain-containing protein
MSIRSEVAQARSRTMTQLARLRDEARVKLHLLSIDTRQRWTEIEQAIVALETRAAHEGEKATELLTESARELTRSVGDFMVSHLSTSPGLLTSVRRLMSVNVRSCKPGDALNRAAQSMWEGDCGCLPVVDDDGRVLGLVTDRDICMASYTQGKSLAELSVEGSMSKQVHGCGPDESVGEALALMGEHRLRRLPVQDASGKLLGMLSLADVARWASTVQSPVIDAALADVLGELAKPTAAKLTAAA